MKLTAKASLYIQKPIAEVFEAIVDPRQMSQYFIGSSSGRITTGGQLTWEFSDFPGPFPVDILEVKETKLIRFVWDPATIVEITLEEKDGSTFVKITEGEKELSEENLKWLADNSFGWGNFLDCLKAWLEYGINLRKGAFRQR